MDMSIKKLLMMTLLSLCWVSVFAEDDTNVLFKWTAAASTDNKKLKVWSLPNEGSGQAQYSWVSSEQSAKDNNGFVIDNTEGYYFSTGAWNRMMMIDKASFQASTILTLQKYGDLTVAVTVNYLRDGKQTDDDPAQISLKYYNSETSKWVGFCKFDDGNDYKSLTSDGSVTLTITNNLATEYDMAVEGKHLKIKSVIISYFSKEHAKELNKQYLTGKTYDDAEINPYYIASWYQKESTNPISFSLVKDKVELGDVMRVFFRGAVEDSYAFLKDWTNSNEIMTGSDKFSINGWKYMDITVNQKLKDLIDNDDLWIGGNNYTISGIYFLHDNKSYEDWQDRGAEARSTYTPKGAEKTLKDWDSSITVPGKFFTYKDGEESNDKIDNTKNAIIRINYTTTADGAQIAVKDNGSNTDGSYGSYSRNRKKVNGSYIYYDYFDLTSGTGNFDIVFSDAITKFHKNETSGNNEPVIGPDGQMTGMMSKIQRDGIRVSGKNVTINSVSIIPTQVAKYVSGCAVINHKLSAKYYKPISLSCNMDNQETIKKVFGTDNVYELGTTEVKKESNSTGGDDYHIYIHFKKATSIRANYPYIIKLDGSDKSTFTYDGVKANTRDYTTYTCYTPAFTYDASITNEDKAKFEEYLKDQQMLFISTAPVIKMKTSSVGDVEVITGVDDYTKLNTYKGSGKCDYYFYKGVLYPNMQDRSIKSGLAYIQLTENLKKVFDNPKVVFGQTQAKSGAFYSFVFDDDNTVTGISSLPACNPRRANVNGVYNLNGQRVTASADELQHLPAGIYIVNGHKLVVR